MRVLIMILLALLGSWPATAAQFELVTHGTLEMGWGAQFTLIDGSRAVGFGGELGEVEAALSGSLELEEVAGEPDALRLASYSVEAEFDTPLVVEFGPIDVLGETIGIDVRVEIDRASFFWSIPPEGTFNFITGDSGSLEQGFVGAFQWGWEARGDLDGTSFSQTGLSDDPGGLGGTTVFWDFTGDLPQVELSLARTNVVPGRALGSEAGVEVRVALLPRLFSPVYVPEPSAACLIAASVLGLARSRRRRVSPFA